ncbi:hypothetical protein Syun_015999 [Stephania yunnanensis]|uniref:Uncharacterized protein n=1 Tax=Stephania yunnanensis TaxID=152371 RepID=A0AAP0J6K4_9MAGN
MTRGMDVEGVRNVINYDLPPYIKTYIHRAAHRKSRASWTLLYLVKKSRELENRVASLDNSTSKKMNQLKTTISKSTNLFRLNPNQALPILQTHHFCSATPATEQPPDQSSQVDPFLRSSNQSIVYGRLTGNGPYTMKTDIIHMLEGCDLSLQDVRVEYNRYYDPVAMHVDKKALIFVPKSPNFGFQFGV